MVATAFIIRWAVSSGMGRGYLADDVFHDVRECEDCVDPKYELPMSKALKMGASLCETCTNYGN